MAGYFAIFLVALTIGSGLIWLFDAVVLAPKRKVKLVQAEVAAGAKLTDEVKQQIAPQSYIAETAQSIFPLIAIITIFRSFLYEPFQIPSGSMMPTLLVGDFILVEKYSYDVKDPVWRKTLLETGKPDHGDVAVFKYPEQPTVDFIKRVIGLPGDRIVYKNKQLYIQKACDKSAAQPCPTLEPMRQELKSEGEFFLGPYPLKRFTEQGPAVTYDILQNAMLPEPIHNYYRQPGTATSEFIVPEGHYFVMGDNRDNSRDSRFWGFVPEQYLVGKAVLKWMSFEFTEDPNSWVPGWVPIGVRFERLGAIE
ncbi:signal peptidase I [Rheinheimera sp. SA_1]|jgi:signal peptidase I|uniref:signal peptidase I n=1 Tax=Rheinheimera sp. SA_1 TaxID=1827365 RepID=UPI0007FE9E02|nr:signal peptidase I [Rheinheimera sp. SA_1]OBP13893.1 signal peptidase I [Rheinheimera sp. SA_1]